jgi:hypothetical protein
MTSVPLDDRRARRAGAGRSRRLRWPLALLIAGGSMVMMTLLAMLQSSSCAGRIATGCIEVPIGLLYALHAVAVGCCLWAIVGALLELLEARRGASAPPASNAETHR